MVSIYKEDHGDGVHYHLGDPHKHTPRQREIFSKIARRVKEELPEEHCVEGVKLGYKIMDKETKRQKLYFNCYRSDSGERVKIIPSDEQFLEEFFRPIVKEIDIPEDAKYDFHWVGIYVIEDQSEQFGVFEMEGPFECKMCGKMIQPGECMVLPHESGGNEVEAYEIISNELYDTDPTEPYDFRVCLECAEQEGRCEYIKNHTTFDDPATMYAGDWLKKQVEGED